MTKQVTSNYPPRGLLKVLFRVPVYFYRFGLGWLFGKKFVLINHIGRVTGLDRQAVVEVVEREAGTGNVIVAAGYGEQTQWYRNLRANPETVIQIGNREHPVRAEFVSPEGGEDIIARYIGRYGAVAAGLFRMMGYEWDGTEAGAREIARDGLRFVRFVFKRIE